MRVFFRLLVSMCAFLFSLQVFPFHGDIARKAFNYQGPADLIGSSAIVWWGLRAYSTSTAGSNCVKVRRSSDNTTLILKTVSNGDLDVASAVAFAGGGLLFVDTLYDQTGGGHDATQATIAKQPQLVLPSGVTTRPYMAFVVASTTLLNYPSITQAQPFTGSMVVNRTGTFTTLSRIMYDNAGASTNFRFAAVANQVGMNWSTAFVSAANDSVWHAVQQVANGAASVINIDGTESIGNAGASGLTTSGAIGCTPGGGTCLDGRISELGVWAGVMSGANRTKIQLNQKIYWGL
jgi:hypothetical protein